MFEFDRLKYLSKPRPKNAKGTSYCGVAIIVNSKKFIHVETDVFVPKNLDVFWSIIRPKEQSFKFKEIIACCFYSPPTKGKNTALADHIVFNLHMLKCKHPESAVILGADQKWHGYIPFS